MKPSSPSPNECDVRPGASGVGETTSVLSDSAPRRTWLAAERTYLAWLRTGLGALVLAVLTIALITVAI